MRSCVPAPMCANRDIRDFTLGRESFGEEKRAFMSIDPKNADHSTQTSPKPRREKTPAERVMPPVLYQLHGMDAVTVACKPEKQ
jgi:hypothetical protein